jgi:hypothetical protein
MLRRGLRLALLAAMVTSTACALVLDLGDERTFGEGGASDGAIADADGGTVPADGGADASVSRFCAAVGHDFCEDFDEPDALGDWIVRSGIEPGTLAVTDTPDAPSPPFVLHATDQRRTFPHRVQIAKQLPHAWSHTVVAFDAFVAAPVLVVGDNIGNGLATLNFFSARDGGGVSQGAGLSFGPTSGVLGTLSFGTMSEGVAGENIAAQVFPFNRWVHFVFDAVPGSLADAGTVVLDMDHDAGHWQATFPSIRVGDTSVYVQIELGSIGFNSPSPAIDLSIDNVTVDFVGP